MSGGKTRKSLSWRFSCFKCNGFAVRIDNRDALRAGSKTGSDNRQHVDTLEGDTCGLPTDGNRSGALKAAPSNGHGGSPGCGNGEWRNAADSERNTRELDDGKGRMLW